jgi:hypothetical protein
MTREEWENLMAKFGWMPYRYVRSYSQRGGLMTWGDHRDSTADLDRLRTSLAGAGVVLQLVNGGTESDARC